MAKNPYDSISSKCLIKWADKVIPFYIQRVKG